MWESLKLLIDNKTKVVDCNTMLEFVLCNQTSPSTLSTCSTTKINAYDSKCSNVDIFYLSRFLSADFINKSFILASKKCNICSSSDADMSLPNSSDRNVKIYFHDKNKNVSRENNNSGVWGSPLKCDIPLEDEFDVFDSCDESQVYECGDKPKINRLGITLELARKVISTFNINIDGNISDLPSILALCDGHNSKNIALIGAKTIFIRKSSMVKKVCKIMTLTVRKKIKIDDCRDIVQLGKLNCLSCRALYHVIPVMKFGFKCQWNVEVELAWKRASHLGEIPPADASAIIKISHSSGMLYLHAISHVQIMHI